MSFKGLARHSSGGGIVAQMNPQELKQKKKERILTTLTRLNDRDTQRFAADELLMIIRELDSETFPILLNCLCSTGSDQKMYARRECARALGFLTADACPTRFLALQPPALNKILNQIKKAMSDSDAGVREACSEALGVIGMGLVDAENQLLIGSIANPVVKVIFDALSVQSKETQGCASQALLALAPSLGTLEKDMMSAIMKMLKSPSFLSASSLLTAFASCDPELHLPVGLVQNTVEYILPSLSTVLGHGPQGTGVHTATSGILGCLAHKDWQVRKAAADSVRALALLLGPHMEAVDPTWDETNPASLCGRCIRSLEACKFDKVKPVRDVVQDTLTILYELLEHGKANGAMDDWVQAVEERSQVKANLPPSQNVIHSVSRPSSRQGSATAMMAGVRSSSMIEGFKHHAVEDVVVAAPRAKSMLAGFSQPGLNSQQQHHEEVHGVHEEANDLGQEDVQMQDSDDVTTPTNGVHTGEYADVAAVPQTNGHAALTDLPEPEADFSPIGTAEIRQPSTDGGGRMMQVPVHEWEQMQADLARLYDSHQQLMQMVLRLTEDSNTAISTLQSRVSSLEQANAAPAVVNPINTARSPSPMRTASSPLPPQSPSASPSHPATHSPPATSLRTSGEIARSMSRLRSSSSSLHDEALGHSPASPAHHHTGNPPRCLSSPPLRTSSAPHTPTGSPAPHTPEHITPMSSERNISPWRERGGTGDLDGAYAEALRSQGGSPTTDLKLARLLQKTGPVWSELSQETAIMLLQTFNNMIESGSTLPRIMPWLWRLADENCAPVDVPQTLKSNLLAALNTCQAGLNDDVQTQERVKLLRSTLMTVWGMKDATRASPLNSPLSSRSLRVRCSLEGLATLQGQLDNMQRDFRSGSQSPTSPHSARREDQDPLL